MSEILFKMCFVNVGQADTILGYFPNGNGFIVDIFRADRIIPILKAEHIKEVKFVLISHCDTDHYDGIYDLVRDFHFNGQNLYINFDRGPKTENYESYHQLLRHIKTWEEDGILHAEPINTDTSLNLDSVGLQVLHPTHAFLGGMITTKGNWNNSSVVIKVSDRKTSVLLAADIEDKGIDELLSNHNDLKCDVLKMPHHGAYSKKNTLSQLLDKTNPRYAIISVGTKNSHNHPDKKTLEILKEREIECFCTQATSICSDSIDDIREKVLEILTKENVSNDGIDNCNGCPCAGNIYVELGEKGASFFPANCTLKRIKGLFNSKACC